MPAISPRITYLVRQPGLTERADAAIPRGGARLADLVDRGSGATVTDVDGNVLLDFSGGLGTLNATPTARWWTRWSHRPARSPTAHVAMHEPYLILAERSTHRARRGSKTVLVNSGVEAVENAVKIAGISLAPGR
jgi:4-aminobutyrate aminotransferase/(S)-3-amino-2-methylpropionate transaminase